jgi:hypothetical protein
MGVVRLDIGFTAVHNVVGIGLAAFGLLPPIFAAALQSVPGLGIMGNSARLRRHRPPAEVAARSPLAGAELECAVTACAVVRPQAG